MSEFTVYATRITRERVKITVDATDRDAAIAAAELRHLAGDDFESVEVYADDLQAFVAVDPSQG